MLKSWIRSIAWLAGMSAVAVGLWQVSQPLSLVVTGGLVVVLTTLGALLSGKNGRGKAA